MNGQSLKSLVESDGIHVASNKIAGLLKNKKVQHSDFSLRELWEAFVGPVGSTLEGYGKMNEVNFVGLREGALDSTAFATITGQLIAAKVLEGYNSPGFIGTSLCSNFPSKRKSERIAGFTANEGLLEVAEGDEYEDSDLGEKFVTTETKKKGRLISVTEEAVYFDQTGQLLIRAKGIGKRAALDKEKTILLGVTQPAAAYYTYRPAGVATALYTNGWELKGSNALADWTNIEAAELAQAAAVDEAGEYIVGVNPIILVPTALAATGRRITNLTEIRQTDGANLTEISGNPLKTYNVLSNTLVHNLQVGAGVAAGTAASNWWIGDFTEQFYWQEIWPIQVLSRKPGSDDEWKRDIVAGYKVRHYGGIFSVDNKYVLKNTA